MIWGDESAGRSDLFEAKALPDAEYIDAANSQILGVGSATPTVEPTAEGGGFSEVSASSGKTAWRRRLSPRHRRAVGSFFTSAQVKSEDQ
jgi:hypothetical protein